MAVRRGGRKMGLGDFLGERHAPLADLPSAPRAREERDTAEPEYERGFARRDYGNSASATCGAGGMGIGDTGEADFAVDWRAAAAEAAEARAQSEQRPQGMSDEAWGDFRTAERSDGDDGESREESWDFRRAPATTEAASSSAEATQDWAAMRVKGAEQRAAAVAAAGRPEASGDDLARLRFGGREEAPETSTSASKASAVERGSGGRPRLKLKPRTGPAPLPPPQEAASKAAKSDPFENASDTANGDEAAASRGDKWERAFQSSRVRRSAKTGDDAAPVSRREVRDFGSLTVTEKETAPPVATRAFGGLEPSETRESSFTRSSAFSTSTADAPRARGPAPAAFGSMTRGRAEHEAKPEAFSSAFSGPQARQRQQTSASRPAMPAAFSQMRRREEPDADRAAAFSAFGAPKRAEAAATQPPTALRPRARPQDLLPSATAATASVSAPSASRSSLSASEQIAQAASADPDLAKATLKRHAAKILDDLLVDISVDPVSPALTKLEQLGMAQYRSVVIQAALEKLETALPQEQRALQAFLVKACLPQTATRGGKKFEFATASQFCEALENVLPRLEGSHAKAVVHVAKQLSEHDSFSLEDCPEGVTSWLREHGLRSGAEDARQSEQTVSIQDLAYNLIQSGSRGEALAESVASQAAGVPAAEAAPAVMRAVLLRAHEDQLITVKAPWLDEDAYGPLLEKFCYDVQAAGVEALFTMQEFFAQHGYLERKGVLEGTLMQLYQNDIVQDEVFFAWKDDTSRQVPGKTKALFATSKWFGWLESQLEEEDSEDEEDEDEADQPLTQVNRGQLR